MKDSDGTVNLTAAVCKERDGSGCNKKSQESIRLLVLEFNWRKEVVTTVHKKSPPTSFTPLIRVAGNEQAKGIQGLVNRLALMKVSRNNGAAVTKDSLGLLWKVIRLCGAVFRPFSFKDKGFLLEDITCSSESSSQANGRRHQTVQAWSG